MGAPLATPRSKPAACRPFSRPVALTANQNAGTVNVSGVDNSDTILNGGQQNVEPGGTAVNYRDNAWRGVETVAAGGESLNPDLSAGGSINLAPGSVLIGGEVESGATLIIPNGVTVTGVTIDPGGVEIVESGGTANNNIDSGTAFVQGGGTDLGGTVGFGGQETVQNGGTANGVTIAAGGTETVLSGGSLVDSILDAGGALNLLPGAVVTAARWRMAAFSMYPTA